MALDWCWYRQSDLNIVVAEAVQLRTEAAVASGGACGRAAKLVGLEAAALGGVIKPWLAAAV